MGGLVYFVLVSGFRSVGNIENVSVGDVIQDETEKFYLDGAHRCMSPAATIDRVKPFLPIMGITRVANITGLDRVGIPVTMAVRPNSRSVATSQGKGTSLNAAMASALMESIETYHAEHILLPLKYASYEEMRFTHSMVDVEALPLVRNSNFHAFHQLLWIEGMNLLDEMAFWVPYELVHTNYTRPLPAGSSCFLATSNGLASGNNSMEAICHAICEVIERDAVALWTQLDSAKRQLLRIDLKTISDENCLGMLQKFEDAGIDVAVWDATSDLGVPTILTWVMENGEQDVLLGRPSVGAGCHPVREIALSRALSEAAQERLTLIAGSRDDLKRSHYDDMHIKDVFEATGTKDFNDVNSVENASTRKDVEWLLDQLKRAGFSQILSIDLSQEYFGEIAVVRVIIPGLDGVVDDPRYVPGVRAASVRGGGS